MSVKGRPTVYTEVIADEILSRLAEGESLRSICRDAHIPTDTVVQEWARGEPRDGRDPFEDGREAFAVRYAHAREQGYEKMAEEILQIADASCEVGGQPDNALVQKQRLQVDSRKWLLSKMLPKKYGDKVTQELVGDGERPIVSRIELVPIAPRLRPER